MFHLCRLDCGPIAIARPNRVAGPPMPGRLSSAFKGDAHHAPSSGGRVDIDVRVWIARGLLARSTQPSVYVGDPVNDAPARVNTWWTFAFSMPPQKRPVSDAHHLRRVETVYPTIVRQHFAAELLVKETSFWIFFRSRHCSFPMRVAQLFSRLSTRLQLMALVSLSTGLDGALLAGRYSPIPAGVDPHHQLGGSAHRRPESVFPPGPGRRRPPARTRPNRASLPRSVRFRGSNRKATISGSMQNEWKRSS
jgi:hypothetical protein